jgi:murein DD-endopeptidase MepM/ murein hydrolase activator NlpD
MAKSQYPIDGKPGKAWKVTSKFGYRVHPIKKTKKHHNGVDIWKGGNPYLEACFDGKVVGVSTSTDPNGAGNKVVVQSKVMGKKVTWTYFHMVKGSIKVKVGQKISAGTVVGRMGQTGFATGDHLHWEIWAGHLKSQPLKGFATGKGFYDPMKFTAAAIEWEKVNVEAGEETSVEAPVEKMPAHSVEAPVKVVEPVKPAPVKPVSAPAVEVPTAIIKEGSSGALVKKLQGKLGIAVDGDFGPNTRKAVVGFQVKHDLIADGIVGPKTWKALYV